MAGGYRAPAGDQYEAIVDALRGLGQRLSELEAPTGTSMNSLVAQVQQAIANINTTVNAAITANSYTKTQIDTKIASPGAISPTTVTASGATSAASLVTTGDVTIGGQGKCLDAYNTDITWTRKTMWVGNDGRMGFASSAEDKKTSIQAAGIDTAALLSLVPRSFFYRAEIERRTRLRIEGIDLDYRPAREIGLLAHEVDAVAPWLVYHDEAGKAEGVEYSMLTVGLLAVAREQAQTITTQAADIAALKAAVAVLQGKPWGSK